MDGEKGRSFISLTSNVAIPAKRFMGMKNSLDKPLLHLRDVYESQALVTSQLGKAVRRTRLTEPGWKSLFLPGRYFACDCSRSLRGSGTSTINPFESFSHPHATKP